MQTTAICCIRENKNYNNGVKCLSNAYTDQLVLRNQYCFTKHVLNSTDTSVQAEDKSYPPNLTMQTLCSLNKKWLIISSAKLTLSVSTNN